MIRTIADKLPGVTMSKKSYQSSKSSGISLSGQTTQSNLSLEELRLSRLRKITYELENGRTSIREEYIEQESNVPRLPKIHAKYGETNQQNKTMKCRYRLPASPQPSHKLATSLVAPPTVGKYRHRVKIIPLCSLPTPAPPQTPTNRLNAAHVLKIKEEYSQERLNNLFNDNEVDMSKILEQFSIARYLTSRDPKIETLRRSPTRSIGSRKSFPTNKEVYETIENKEEELTWNSKLGAWIQPGKRRHIRYLKLCGGARITTKPRYICCHNHDSYHHNLNKEYRDHICPRYTHHHTHNPARGSVSLISIPNKNQRGAKKMPTIPKDPFTSKSQRQIKKSWLAPQVKRKVTPLPPTPVQSKVDFTLPSLHDDLYPPQWMVDNSTMTEETFSEIISIAKSSAPSTRYSTPVTIASSYNYGPILKRNSVLMVDKACEAALSGTPGSSRRHSICSESTHSSTIRKDSSAIDLFNTDHEIEDNVSTVMEGIKFENDDLTNETLIETECTDEQKEITNSENVDLELNTNEPTMLNENKESLKNVEPIEAEDLQDEDNLQVSKVSTEEEESLMREDTTSIGGDSCRAVIASDSEKSLPMIKRIPTPSKSIPPPPKLLHKIVQNPPGHTSTLQEIEPVKEKVKKPIVIPPPKLLLRQVSSKSSRSTKSRIMIHMPSPTPSQRSKKRRGEVIRDNALAEELRKTRLAEERRKRAKEIFEKQKRNQQIPAAKANVEIKDDIEDDPFLGKFCILNPAKMDLYKRTFDMMDLEEKGYIDAFEVLEALQKVTPSNTLEDADVNYIYRLLEMIGCDVLSERTNFKTFTILASLAQKISSLDDFVKGYTERFDFKSLDTKVFRARQMFQNYAETGHKMSKESLWLELQAGGITEKHENEV